LTRDSFATAMVEGLSARPRQISPKWFYDAEGSRLFDEITRLPEYYPTRQEAALLRATAPRLAVAMGPGAILIEFGSGASEKTRILLDAAPQLSTYVPIDISPEALGEAAAGIEAAYPGLVVRPMVADFLNMPPLPADLGPGRRVGFFPGSTIGNLSRQEAQTFLGRAREQLGQGALFILGVDLVKDPQTLVAAYDDAAGVTAAFNRNLLVRANALLGADFDLSAFAHRALWNADESRIEMHLVSNVDQVVTVAGRRFDFPAGETIHTESSRKFTSASLGAMTALAGWRIVDLFESDEPKVALALLEA
jgi:dimethylhistidine N-methyltransferase